MYAESFGWPLKYGFDWRPRHGEGCTPGVEDSWRDSDVEDDAGGLRVGGRHDEDVSRSVKTKIAGEFGLSGMLTVEIMAGGEGLFQVGLG